MTQMNLPIDQKQIHRPRERICVCRGNGEGLLGSLGLTDADYYMENGQTTGSFCRAEGSIFNIL